MAQLAMLGSVRDAWLFTAASPKDSANLEFPSLLSEAISRNSRI
nr:hypothetical protein [uncultured Campylobacter sp.]